MRIAIESSSRIKIGGREIYLENIISLLIKKGHQLAYCYEFDHPDSDNRISLPAGISEINFNKGLSQALDQLRDFNPDIIYSHGLEKTTIATETLKIAPAIFFAHSYHGNCISGSKTFKFPVLLPCDRKFGWGCLIQYYPKHCGGWHPLSMLNHFQLQSTRLAQLKHYQFILTFTEHMRHEYEKYGLKAYTSFAPVKFDTALINASNINSNIDLSNRINKILFIGRLDRLKGGDYLIKAMAEVCKILPRNYQIDFAGDGKEHAKWQALAKEIMSQHPQLKINFLGWQSREQINQLLSESDLLVVPSVWPEPFGLIGYEASHYNLPVVAFNVGGIPEWLKDGFNGHLADAHPPTATSLANAIVKSLSDNSLYNRLRYNAAILIDQLTMELHAENLIQYFQKALIK